MEYITSIQRIGLEEGLQKGTANSLERLASKRFNVERQAAAPIFAGLAAEQLEELVDFFLEAESLDDIRQRADEMRRASKARLSPGEKATTARASKSMPAYRGAARKKEPSRAEESKCV